MEVAQGIQKLRQCLCKTHQLHARLKRRIGTKNDKANHVRIQSFFSMKVTGDQHGIVVHVLFTSFHTTLYEVYQARMSHPSHPSLDQICRCSAMRLCRSVVEFQSHGRDQTARQNHRIALFVFELVLGFLGVEDVRMASLFA